MRTRNPSPLPARAGSPRTAPKASDWANAETTIPPTKNHAGAAPPNTASPRPATTPNTGKVNNAGHTQIIEPSEFSPNNGSTAAITMAAATSPR